MSASGLLHFMIARAWMNLKAGLEYRVSFWSQVFFMMANNLFLLWFWHLFFAQFGSIQGWNAQDMYLLYAVCTLSFGLANVVAGNALDLAGAVTDGDLDYYIGLPAPTLLHALVTKMRVSALGDLVFGLLLLGLLYWRDPVHILVGFLVAIPAAIVFVSAIVLCASLAFYVGESKGVAMQMMNLIVTFGTYPESIFQGRMRWILYILIPAALFSHVPAAAVRHAGSEWALLGMDLITLGLGAAAFCMVSVFVFYRGLRRYASGSAMGLRM